MLSDVMSTKERLLQSLLFEVILILINVPVIFLLGSFGTAMSTVDAAVISVVGAVIAMGVNYFYNIGFDRSFGHVRIERSKKLRIFHAVGFESILLLTFLPFLMWYTSMGLLEAIMMDAVLMGMTLVYTYIFHWAYDNVRHRYLQDK